MSAEPLRLEFAVAASPAQAFSLWTEGCARWWPRGHTVSGDPAAITFEPRPGGRIYERGRDGADHQWGEVLDWDPPARLRYRWHLFFERSEATEVTVTFSAHANGTSVTLEQRGFDQLGAAGVERRAKTGQAWSRLTALYAAAAER